MTIKRGPGTFFAGPLPVSWSAYAAAFTCVLSNRLIVLPFIGVLTLLVLYCSSCQIQNSPLNDHPDVFVWRVVFRFAVPLPPNSRETSYMIIITVLSRQVSDHWRVMGVIAQGYCYGYRRIDALKLHGHSRVLLPT